MADFFYRLKRYFVATHIHNKEVIHGHNFYCIATFQLKNPDKCKKELEKTLNKLHYKILNDLPYFRKKTPSTENIALFIFRQLEKKAPVIEVKVYETENFSGGYRK